MWLCSAVGRCPRRLFFQIVGSWRVFMSLISLHSTQTLESIMAVLLSILQGNTCTAKDDCQGWLVSTHPPFLVSIVKTWGFDMLRAGWGHDCSPMLDTALNDGLFFWISYCGLGSSLLIFGPMFFSRAFLDKRYWSVGNNLFGVFLWVARWG